MFLAHFYSALAFSPFILKSVGLWVSLSISLFESNTPCFSMFKVESLWGCFLVIFFAALLYGSTALCSAFKTILFKICWNAFSEALLHFCTPTSAWRYCTEGVRSTEARSTLEARWAVACCRCAGRTQLTLHREGADYVMLDRLYRERQIFM